MLPNWKGPNCLGRESRGETEFESVKPLFGGYIVWSARLCHVWWFPGLRGLPGEQRPPLRHQSIGLESMSVCLGPLLDWGRVLGCGVHGYVLFENTSP